jgi:hypothetical protein
MTEKLFQKTSDDEVKVICSAALHSTNDFVQQRRRLSLGVLEPRVSFR